MANWPAIGSVILPNVGGIASGLYFAGQICKCTQEGPTKAWYDGLKKPNWVAPKCAMGPATVLMYSSMGYASYLVYNECGGFTEDAVLPLTLYGGQLLLNWGYAPIFFGLKDIKLAFIEISVATGALAATAVAFSKVDRKAALLLLPGLAWLAYNTALNHFIWKNNPEKIKELGDDKSN